jgi:hypothetical protein
VIASWLFEFFLPAQNGEAMLGDLIEEYPLRLEATSRLAASGWFWSQACRSVPHVLRSWMRSGSCLISMGVAMGVCLCMGMLKLVADRMIAKLVAPDPTTHVVLAPIVFLATTAIGGCIAARIRRGATIFLSLIVMITVAVLMDLKLCTIPVPWWYPIGFLTLGPLAVVIAPAMFWSLKARTGGVAT